MRLSQRERARQLALRPDFPAPPATTISWSRMWDRDDVEVDGSSGLVGLGVLAQPALMAFARPALTWRVRVAASSHRSWGGGGTSPPLFPKVVCIAAFAA